MEYVKVMDNGYILAVGSGIENGVSITVEEYNKILAAIKRKPPATETVDYRLREDLTWEAFDRPEPEQNDPTPDEILSVLLGGAQI